jgi:hypothetical protein
VDDDHDGHGLPDDVFGGVLLGGDNYDRLLGLGVGGEDPHRKVTTVKRTFNGLVMLSKNS